MKTFASYLAPGPFPAAEVGEPGSVQAPSTTIPVVDDGSTEVCFLTGNWKLFQGLNAHRYSTDDVATAWVAFTAAGLSPGTPGMAAGTAAALCPPPLTLASPRILDIGCGIGSVLHMNAWCHPGSACVGLEAQASRAAQALRSARYNAGAASISDSAAWIGQTEGVPPRLTVVNGDLRDAAALPQGAVFDLITGTPPYFDPTTAPQTNFNERNACLSEIRGGIEVYCKAAARWLAPNGTFVVCNANLNRQRSFEAAKAAGLVVTAVYDFIPRQGKPVLFFVLVARKLSASATPALSAVKAASQSQEGAAAPDYSPPSWALDAAALPDTVVLARSVVAPSGAQANAFCFEGTVDCGVDPIAPALSPAQAAAVAGESMVLAAKLPQAAMHVPESATHHVVVVRDGHGVRTPQYARLLRQMGKPG